MKPQNIERFVKLEEEAAALAVMVLGLASTIRTLRAKVDNMELQQSCTSVRDSEPEPTRPYRFRADL